MKSIHKSKILTLILVIAVGKLMLSNLLEEFNIGFQWLESD